MSSPDVVVIGDINVDILARIDHYPPPGGHGLADEVCIESGGSAANTAALLGRFGLDVAMVGCVGDDSLAGLALQSLQSAGVDVSRVRRHPAATTGIFLVAVTPDGERTMFGGRGANSRLSPSDVDADVIKAARWLHLSGYALLSESGTAALQEAVDVARGAGIPVSLDVGIGPATEQWRRQMLELAAQVDLLLPNAVEAESLTGECDPAQAAQQLRSGKGQTVLLKLGKRGCYVSSSSEGWTQPAFDVEAVDSTGAGDACNAAFIAGRRAGLDTRSSALLANACGALATTTVGAGSSLPEPADVLRFLNEYRDDPAWAGWADEFDVVCGWLAESLSNVSIEE